MTNPAIDAKLNFLVEADRLKSVVRANHIIDGTRCENTAEHSWHVALYALIFSPYAAPDVDIDRAIAMLLLHDIVEIDAGDHPIHLTHDADAIRAAEQRAADRLFGLLPLPIGTGFRALWDEFDAGQTATAQYARLIDTIHPVYQTICSPYPLDEHLAIVDVVEDAAVADLL